MLNTLRTARLAAAPGRRPAQRGVMLLEAMISIAIFSIAVLGLVGLQSAAIKNTEDARQRAVAAFYANQILGQMWADAPANLSTYAHNINGTACGGFSGAASTNDNVSDWISAIQSQLNGLTSDEVASTLQQIKVDANNVVAVTLCWQNPGEGAYHFFTTAAQVRGRR